MRDLTEFSKYRRGLEGFDNNDPRSGFFIFSRSVVDKTLRHGELRVIASCSHGWDHVSISRVDCTPTWEEMEWVRRKFFKPEEFAFQYHAPIADYVDGSFKGNCKTCLHLWRPHEAEHFPTPPKYMVGGMSVSDAEFAMLMHEADRREKGLPI